MPGISWYSINAVCSRVFHIILDLVIKPSPSYFRCYKYLEGLCAQQAPICPLRRPAQTTPTAAITPSVRLCGPLLWVFLLLSLL